MSGNKPIDPRKQLLQKYLDGQCTPEEKRQVLNWFYSNELDSSQKLLEEQRVNSLGNVKRALMENLEEGLPLDSIKKRFNWMKYSIAAAAVLLLLSIGAIVYKNSSFRKEEFELAALVPDVSGMYKNDILPGSIHAYRSYQGNKPELLTDQPKKIQHQLSNHVGNYLVEVPKAGTFKLQLEDGTIVWLNSSSSLDYPEIFSKQERRVKLKGEAYFEVSSDADRPFRIDVEGTTIEVLGTSFNINAYEKQVNTTLVEGKVKILKGGQERYLLPGQEGMVVGNDIDIEATDVVKSTAWKRGEFYFDRNNLQDILAQLARWYNVEVINGESLTLNSSYTGSISRASKLSDVLNVLAYATKKKFEIDGRKVIVK